MKPIKDNTLCLTINQAHFNDIISGKIKSVGREIKDTTYKKYLLTWHEDGHTRLYYNESLLPGDPVSEIYIYNNGIYPYLPVEYKFLSLAVGADGERDILIVEIEDITFQPALQKNGYPIRFNMIDDEFKPCKNGNYCCWNIVYHLGKVIENKHKRSGRENIIL
jgi:hypothetical protein